MGMWDEWMKNIPKGFRFVALGSDEGDLFSFLQGKTPDQVADEKTKAMTENDALAEWEAMSEIPPWEQEDRMADELLNDNDDLWTPTPGEQAQIDASPNPALSAAIFRDKDPSLWDNITDWLGDNIGIGGGFPGEMGGSGAINPMSGALGAPQYERAIAIQSLQEMMDPQDPNTLEGIKEDIAKALAQNLMKPEHVREWMSLPSFGAGLNPNDYNRLGFGSLEEVRDTITPFLDYVDATQGNIPPSYTAPDMWGSVVGGYWGKGKFLEAASNPDLYNKETQKIIAMFENQKYIASPTTDMKDFGAGLQEPPGAMRDMGGAMDSAMARAMSSDALGLGGQDATTQLGVQPGTQTGTQPGTQAGTGGGQMPGGMRQQIDYNLGLEKATRETAMEDVFYTRVYGMEGAGDPSRRDYLPVLYNNTKMLFLLYNPDVYDEFPEGWDQADAADIPAKEWNIVERRFDKFLSDYFNNAQTNPFNHNNYYYGKRLDDTVAQLNEEITRSFSGQDILSGVAGSRPEGLWRENVLRNINLLDLAILYNTRGIVSPQSTATNAYLREVYDMYKKMGRSDAEIFQIFTTKQPQQASIPSYTNIPETPGKGSSPGPLDNTAVNKILDEAKTSQFTPSPKTYADSLDTDALYEMNQEIPTGRTDQQVLHDAISANLRMTGRGSVDSGVQPDPSVEYQAVKGLSKDHLMSMPLAFDDVEHAKKMKGLPYIQLYVKNGKRIKGTTFVPTRGWKAGAGTERRKERLMKELSQA